MYLRPRQIFQKFLVEEKRTRVNDIGRQVIEFVATGEEIFGVVSSINPKEAERFKAVAHNVDTVIVQHRGRVKAKVGDRLVKENKIYLVQAIDDVVGRGEFFLYFCNERFDLK